MTQKKIGLVVTGCCGRMGSLIIEEVLRDASNFNLVAAIEHGSHPQVGKPLPAKPDLTVTADLRSVLSAADLIVEFTNPDATLDHAREAAALNVPMLIGTTGLTPAQLEELQSLGRKIPIFWSPNMSVGIVIIRRTVSSVSELLFQFGLGEKTSVQISEIHHSKKLDKPSGTAKALAQELFKVTGWLVRDEEIEAKREGDVIGVHAVTFRCPSEQITLRHEATDRRVFAQGATLIARNFHRLWKKPGWYTMDDFVRTMEKSSGERCPA